MTQEFNWADFSTFDRILSWGLALLMAILYFRDRRVMKPYYVTLSKTLIRNQAAIVPGIEVKFGNELVENLTLTRLAIWNAGRAPIQRDDIAESEPLAIRARDGVKLLHVRLIQNTSPASAINAIIQDDKKDALIEFEFFDYRQGAVLEVLHTGTGPCDLTVMGFVKGTGHFLRVSVAAEGKEYMLARRSSPWIGRGTIVFLFGFPTICFLLIPTIWMTLRGQNYAMDGSFGKISLVPPQGFLEFFCLQGAWAIVLGILMLRYKSLPKGLEMIARGLYRD